MRSLKLLLLVVVACIVFSKNAFATLWVQAGPCNLSSCVWYNASNIENDPNYWWPFNTLGDYKGRMPLKKGQSNALIINVTPLNSVPIQGVILCIMAQNDKVDYDPPTAITVDLQESPDGTNWTTVRSKTINFPTDVTTAPERQYGRYFIDFRFDEPYPLDTSKYYRLLIYKSVEGGYSGALRLMFSKNANLGGWTADVTDYAFRIIYSNVTGTPTESDAFVITDELIIDQNWTVGYIEIPTSPAKEKLDSYNNKGSFWITAKGRLYIPSNITSDIKVEQKGRMYVSAGDRVFWQIGDSKDNPIPPDKTVEWFFNCEGTARRAGWFAIYECTWSKVHIYGSPINHWYAEIVEDAPAGQDYIKVKGDVTSEWRVGDKIFIGGTKYSETRHTNDWWRDSTWYEITALSYDSGTNTTTINITPALKFYKEKGGRVILLRRNVKIYGDKITTGNNRADFERISKMQHMKVYWTWVSWVRKFPFIHECHRYQDPTKYDMVDEFVGVLYTDVFNSFVTIRLRGVKFKNIAIAFSITNGGWPDDSMGIYKSTAEIDGFIQISPTMGLQVDSCKEAEVKNFWIQAHQGIRIRLCGAKVHDGVFFNSGRGIVFEGARGAEVYNVLGHGLYQDSNNPPDSTTWAGFFTYIGDIPSSNNYIHDCRVEGGAFSIIYIEADDGGINDWYHNITWDEATVEISEAFREDWVEGTLIKLTKWNGADKNDWMIFKYGNIHRTGEGLDDTVHRTEGGGKYALRLEPKLAGYDFKDYKIRLVDVEAGKPVQYIGYIYVNCSYFNNATDYILPEIYLEGLGIDPTEEPTARWVFPNESYCGKWISFAVVGTAKEPGVAYAVIKIKSDGTYPYVYIDDDVAVWTGKIDYRGEEVWLEGEPARPPAEFPYIVPYDIWNQPISVLQATGTIGRLIVENSKMISPRFKLHKVNTTIPIIFALEEENPYTVKLTIYKLPSGDLVVYNVTMTKMGGTRYYYYGWFANETGEFLIECYAPELFVKDSMVITILSEEEWWATQQNVTTILENLRNSSEILDEINKTVHDNYNILLEINTTTHDTYGYLVSKWGSLTAQQLFDLSAQTRDIARYINETRWGTYIFADIINKWGSYSAEILFTVSNQTKTIADYINTTRWGSLTAQQLYEISEKAYNISKYINETRWENRTAEDLFNISEQIKTLAEEIDQTTKSYNAYFTTWNATLYSPVFADFDVSELVYPGKIWKATLIFTHLNGTPIDADYITVKIYDPAQDIVYETNMTRITVGTYLAMWAIPSDPALGLYTATAEVYLNNTLVAKRYKVFRVAQIGPADLILKVRKKYVSRGDYLPIEITIKNMGGIGADFKLTYWIEVNGRKYSEAAETLFVEGGGELTVIRDIYIPMNVPLGPAIVKAKLYYDPSQPEPEAWQTVEITPAPVGGRGYPLMVVKPKYVLTLDIEPRVFNITILDEKGNVILKKEMRSGEQILLESGRYRIIIEAPGYEKREFDIVISRDTTLVARLEVKKRETPQQPLMILLIIIITILIYGWKRRWKVQK